MSQKIGKDTKKKLLALRVEINNLRQVEVEEKNNLGDILDEITDNNKHDLIDY